VAKSWELLRDEAGNTRTLLIEKVPWVKIAPVLQSLPPPQARIAPAETVKALLAKAGSRPPPREKRPTVKPVRVASLSPQLAALQPHKALLLDYELVSSMPNFSFASDKPYYVSGPVTIGASAWEGNCGISEWSANHLFPERSELTLRVARWVDRGNLQARHCPGHLPAHGLEQPGAGQQGGVHQRRQVLPGVLQQTVTIRLPFSE
jgi:hypothetical protein